MWFVREDQLQNPKRLQAERASSQDCAKVGSCINVYLKLQVKYSVKYVVTDCLPKAKLKFGI